MFRTHFQDPPRHLAPTHIPVAQHREDYSVIYITTNMLVCKVDLDLDGQEFEASRANSVIPSQRGGPHGNAPNNDVQNGSAQRHSARQHAAHAAAMRGEGCSGALCAHHALGARHARSANACARQGPPSRARRTCHARRVVCAR